MTTMHMQLTCCSATCSPESWKSSCHPNTSNQIRGAIRPGRHRLHYFSSLNPNPGIPLRRAVRGGCSKGPSCKFSVSFLLLAISNNPPWSPMGSAGLQLSSRTLNQAVIFLQSLQIFPPSLPSPISLM
jgi:hypothetical protein